MNVYHVNEGIAEGCPRRYVATLKEAKMLQKKYRVKHFLEYGEPPEEMKHLCWSELTIEKVKIDVSKASILRMLNYEGGYEISSEEIV